MAIYRSVHMTFWTDNKVSDEFTPEDKYFYLYLLTNPHTNLCGCYEVGFNSFTSETGYNRDTIERLIDRFENVHHVLMYDKATKEIMVLNWFKYNWTSSEKLEKPLIAEISRVKSTKLKEKLIEIYNSRDTVSIPYAYPMDTSVTVTVTDTVSVTNTVIDYLNKKVGTMFKPTTASTVRNINGRVKEGRTVDDFKAVIDDKCNDWLKDKKMKQYLRPSTLFAPTNFENYLNKAKSTMKGESGGTGQLPTEPKEEVSGIQKLMRERGNMPDFTGF